MLWLDKAINYASLLLFGHYGEGGTDAENKAGDGCGAGGGGRFAPGCVYRGGVRECPPFQVNTLGRQASTYSVNERPCYDINLSLDTMYQFIPVTTSTTKTSVTTTRTTSVFSTSRATTTKISVTTESIPSAVTTTVRSPLYSDVTVVFSTVVTAIGTTSTFVRTVTGSVNVGTSVPTTFITTVPFATITASSVGYTTFQTTRVITSLSTIVTSFPTDAFAAAITIGPAEKDWSYFYNSCANITYKGDGSFVGGPLLISNNTGTQPLFISSNKRYRLYPCETLEVSAAYSLTMLNAQNITSPLGYEGDPAYGAGLMGAFDLDTGFSFYILTTLTRAYAMYSRVPSWCPCVNMTMAMGSCGPCRAGDREDDALFPVPDPPTCNPCGDVDCPVAGGGCASGNCNPCNGGNCPAQLYTMRTQTFPPPVTTTAGSTLTIQPAKAANFPRRPVAHEAKAGFDYYAFTYLVPIDYLTPGAAIKASILLNAGAPSVTYTINGVPRLTITDIGARIDPRFLLGSYGGSADYTDFPQSVQLALGVLAVTESTDGRTACQGGVYEECYQGGQSILDARYTYCNRAAIQTPGTYNLTAIMDMDRLGVTRITKTPRPCCPIYAK